MSKRKHFKMLYRESNAQGKMFFKICSVLLCFIQGFVNIKKENWYIRIKFLNIEILSTFYIQESFQTKLEQ